MRRQRRGVKLLALLFCAVLLAAACGSDKKSDTGAASGSTATDTGTQKRGGTLILGAEQWPECLNPITQCANSSWMHWAVVEHVLPKLLTFDEEGKFIPGPALEGEPVTAGKGTSTNPNDPFSVTYKIRKEAVWDDGTPITGADVEFTWKAKLATQGVVSKVGYDSISKIDQTDEGKTVKVTFTDTFADWQDLFGGNTDFVLKKAAFTSEDISQNLLSEIPFSGTMWKLTSFSAEQAEFVPNPKFWIEDMKPLVDKVIFRPMADTDTELNAIRAGEVFVIYPQPSPGIKDTLSDATLKLQFGVSVSYEGLWFNQSSLKNTDSVLKDKVVREALLFGTDRQAILDQVIHNISPEVQVLNCAGWVPTVGNWCDQDDFADVKYDAAKVASLLEGAGWAKGSDGIYAKGGKRLSFTFQTVAGNTRREAIQDLLIPRWKDIGIEAVKDNSDFDTLFQTRVPQMDTEVALYIQSASPDPSVTAIYACENIPTAANGFAGQNNTGWCNQEATTLLKQSDKTAETTAREDLIHKVGDLVRADAVWLPLYQFPTLTAFRTDKIEGPVGTFTNSPLAGFANMYDWSLK